MTETPITFLCEYNTNMVYVKHEELYPYCFGGNKVRIAENYFRKIDAGNYDCVVTYGTRSSNLCRVVANMAASRNMDCTVVCSGKSDKNSVNGMLTDIFGTKTVYCAVENVATTIAKTLAELCSAGRTPFFIHGGGHGIPGTDAYVDCYKEIQKYECTNGIFFDQIFHASGTGTTQSGLVCGKLISGDKRDIVGISIARKNPYGRNEVIKSVREYMNEFHISVTSDEIEQSVIFEDAFTTDYGADACAATTDAVLKKYGLVLDPVYTGKAFSGMEKYIKCNSITKKNILFIHTGGTPLFFDRFFY